MLSETSVFISVSLRNGNRKGRRLVCLCKRRLKFWSLSSIYPGVRMLKAFVEKHWRAAEGLPLNPVNGFGRCGNSSCSPLRH